MSDQETLIPFGHRGKVAFNCMNCKDQGSFVAQLKVDGSTWAFTCRCPAGGRCKRPYPLYPGDNAGFEVL